LAAAKGSNHKGLKPLAVSLFIIKGIRLPMPTHAQAISSVCICQSLSDMLQPIHLFRYDAFYKQIYILAGINEGI